MSGNSEPPYDAILVVSFGGPEQPADVMPFLENVLRGKNVPRERMLEVAEHYQHFGGRSPINDQNRALIAALREELNQHGPSLPIYWGNRNWHPLLPETLRQMAESGVRRALGFFTSAYSSYSGCRQYRENIEQARADAGPNAPQVDKLRAFYNHPGFLGPMIENTRASLDEIPAERRNAAAVVFTAHSIPQSMANTSAYARQLQEASQLVMSALGTPNPWRLVYQSRSGPPTQPWLEPDVNDSLRELATGDTRDVVVVPIGFISDHLEILYDLDIQARETCEKLGINMVRAATVGTHPRFIMMIHELIVERLVPGSDRPALGTLGASHDVCPLDCCPAQQRPR